jgi:hypothetical protein
MNQQQRAVVHQALWVVRELMDGEHHTYEAIERADNAIFALRQLLEQPEPVQEPVAWAVVGEGEWGEWVIGQQFETNNPPSHEYWKNRGYLLVPLYTTPLAQPAAWVGLTQREWDDLWDEHHDDYGYQLSADGYERAIEAKLREKNGVQE